jgi:hypothetical protein
MVAVCFSALVPTSVAFTPTTNLDPIEGSVSSSFWQFNWGVSGTYGVYLRDVNWNSVNSGSWCLYAGMINVPWVKITDGAGVQTTYDVPGGSGAGGMTLVNRQCTGGPQNYFVIFAYTFPDASTPLITHWLEICFDIYHMPNSRYYPYTPLSNGLIHCWAYHSSNFAQQYTFEVAWRVDLDIGNAGGDDQFRFGDIGTGDPPAFIQLNNEGSRTAMPWLAGAPTNLKVKQVDNNYQEWAGIEPYCVNLNPPPIPDTFYYLRYAPGQYKGNPASYINGQSLVGQDDLWWWLAQNTNQPYQRSNAVIWINVWLW